VSKTSQSDHGYGYSAINPLKGKTPTHIYGGITMKTGFTIRDDDRVNVESIFPSSLEIHINGIHDCGFQHDLRHRMDLKKRF